MKQHKKRKPSIFLIAAAALAVALAFTFVLPRALERIRYPMKYVDQIIERSGEYGVPPALTAAICLTESSYKPDARSKNGALGLMQIMPETGGWIAGILGEEADYAPENLTNADTSLRYGCWYVGFLMKRYEGDEVAVIAAYHAGQGTVDNWINDERYSDGHTLTGFPEGAPNTRHYVAKVRKAYEYYKKAYQ